ncbi:MAG: hypothetical protein IK052_00920 [Bacteroidales bacterium]|nr:hypothetical protein [Bacteroidales bacterium]
MKTNYVAPSVEVMSLNGMQETMQGPSLLTLIAGQNFGDPVIVDSADLTTMFDIN